MSSRLAGLWVPVVTPFTADGSVDSKRQLAHSRELLSEGATGLALLGTTSEANSLTLAERRRVIEDHLAAGVPAEKLIPGTGACAIDDAVELSRAAYEFGCAAVLMLPPFYYKNVGDEGLFAFFARAIEKLGAKAPRILLYHFPKVSAVGFSLELIRRLRESFPEIVVGLKDSSGDWEHTRTLISALPGFSVFPGTELDAIRSLQHGAVGVISASANVNARAIARLLASSDSPETQNLQAEVNAVRVAVSKRGNIEASKAILAERYHHEGWLAVRPPLVPLSAAARADLMADPAIAKLFAVAA